MPQSERITRPVYVPCLLFIGSEAEVLGRCEAAAARLGLVVKACCLDTARAAATTRQPLIVVATSRVHTLHTDEVDEVARIAGALLVKVDAEVSERELGAMFEGALRLRLGVRERKTDAGLYSIIGGVTQEAPLAPRSTPRPEREAAEASDGPITVRAIPRPRPRTQSLPPPPAMSSTVPPVSGERPRMHCNLETMLAGGLRARG